MFKKLRSKLRERYYRYEMRTSSVPTLSTSQLISDLLMLILVAFSLFCVVFYIFFISESTKEVQTDPIEIEEVISEKELRERSTAPKILYFKQNKRAPASTTERAAPETAQDQTVRSSGSIASVQSLNVIETYGAVPAFAQITDNGLGEVFLGKTLVGTAAAMSDVGRIRIRFDKIKVSENKTLPIEAIALSEDGTFGVVASKKEGIIERGTIGSMRSGLGSRVNVRDNSGGFSFESILIGALLRGLQSELQSDIETDYNQATVWSLSAGTDFLVQLVADFDIEKDFMDPVYSNIKNMREGVRY